MFWGGVFVLFGVFFSFWRVSAIFFPPREAVRKPGIPALACWVDVGILAPF